MKVTVNGETVHIDEHATVDAVIERLGLARSICAAEVNGSVVPKNERTERELAEGDRVEIVTLVGGG